MSEEPNTQSTDVAIVVPHTGSVSVWWAIRLSELQLPQSTIVAKSTGALDLARQKTVEEALQVDPDWFLFLDSDVIPPADIFPRLRNRGVDVISGLYYMDHPEAIHPAMWQLDENNSPAITGFDKEGMVNVDAIGLGCLLVNRDVIDDIDPPWFRWTQGYEEHPWDLRQEGENPGISEDFDFCYKIKQAGYEIYVDTTVKCIHEKTCYLSDDGVFLQSQLNPSN
jgi:hypothetical protein